MTPLRILTRLAGLATTSVFLATTPVRAEVSAKDIGFDPHESCYEILQRPDVTKIMAAAWVFGYLGAERGDVRPVDFGNAKTMLKNLAEPCAADHDLSLLELVAKNKAGAQTTAGSEAEARSLLLKFFAPGADLAALTAALFPSEAEVHMVYNDPLASRLAASYAAAFKPGIKFGPKPEHDDLLMYYTTTGRLQAGDPMLENFPGGYKKVLQYFKADVPIVRFKFVKKGETLGLAVDGLVYVNDHWVIMPKPWRGLD